MIGWGKSLHSFQAIWQASENAYSSEAIWLANEIKKVFSGQSYCLKWVGMIWAATWYFQQCGICDQKSLRSACAYAQTDQSLCKSLEYFMSVKLLTKHHLEFSSLKGGCTGSPHLSKCHIVGNHMSRLIWQCNHCPVVWYIRRFSS